MKVNLEPKGVKQLEVYISDLEKEIQELKQKYLNAVADYEQEKFTVEELKKQLETGKEQYNDLVEEKEELQEQLSIKTLQLEEMKLSKRDYTQENILEAEKEQLNRLVNSCQEEIRKLKKQLENKYSKIGTITNEVLYEENTKLINQQKEFIEYLENMLDNENDIFSVVRVKDVLSKYKETIGQQS